MNLKWCLRKCYDHVFFAPDFVERELQLIQKIYTLDRDGFMRCGVDSLFFLHILRPYHSSIKSFYQSLIQGNHRRIISFLDSSFVRKLLETLPLIDHYALSPDSEIKRNVETFYAMIHDKKRFDGSMIQGLLRGLLLFKNTNIIWNSAVITVVYEQE